MGLDDKRTVQIVKEVAKSSSMMVLHLSDCQAQSKPSVMEAIREFMEVKTDLKMPE